VKLMAILTVTVIPTGVALFVPGAFCWWLGVAHLTLVLDFLGPFVLMLHNTSNRKLFRGPWQWMAMDEPLHPLEPRSVLRRIPRDVFRPPRGHAPAREQPRGRLNSTLPYVRDSFAAFLRYFLRFFFLVIFEMAGYFRRKRRRALMVRSLAGEALFTAAMTGLLLANARAALVVFVVRFVLSRFLMMAGNWGQHAFVDRAAPENCYRNSITCINTGYKGTLLQRRLPHRTSPQADAALDRDAPGLLASHPDVRGRGRDRLHRYRLFRCLALADVQALRSARRARRDARRRPAWDRGNRRAPA
jgi:hypothetical protein